MSKQSAEQCQTCVFNRPDFLHFCTRYGFEHGQDQPCGEFTDKFTAVCSKCGVILDVVEWFNFGDKCAMHGIED